MTDVKTSSLELTEDKIAKAFEISDKLNEKKELLSEKLRIVQERYSTLKHKIGDEEFTEKQCWEDFYHNNKEAKTFNILNEKYPDVFILDEEIKGLADELRQYFIMEFGVDYTAMTLTDYIKITRALIKLEN